MKKNRRGLFLVFFSLAGFAALVALDNSRLQDRSNPRTAVHEKTGVSPDLAKKQREAARNPNRVSTPAKKSETPRAKKRPSGARKTM
ncbi:MAG: hypothetical protein HKN21_08465 [Candidatus Eisenbacteria bacterium]|uniref:Uncharacterized protein n=1 Tax=Eiseniibacteriota bacterium TaxID=2212470 RepID=A0A7Y2EBA0_UNCEI|nr:hypothetical protein [Candidatus Eisenbacteria bacterium]